MSLLSRLAAVEAAVTAIGRAEFGDVDGHPFRGNQHTGGGYRGPDEARGGRTQSGKISSGLPPRDGSPGSQRYLKDKNDARDARDKPPTDAQLRSAARTVGAFLNRNARTIPSADKAYEAGRVLLRAHGDTAPVKTAADLRSRLEDAGVVL